MLEEVFRSYSINNPQQIWPIALTAFLQWFSLFFGLTFLGLLIWTIVKIVKERQLDPSSKLYLPRLLGFFFAFLFFLALQIFSQIYQDWV